MRQNRLKVNPTGDRGHASTPCHSKALVLALSHSLQHELADKGIRVQADLLVAETAHRAAAAGMPVANLPAATVDDLVDAALAGLDAGELVTVPALPDGSDGDRFEAACRALTPNLSRSAPAERYGLAVHRAA